MARGGQLKIRVVGDSSDLQKKLGKASSKIGDFAKKAASVGAKSVAAMGAAAIAGAAKVASFGDEIAKSSRKAGLGVEQFQELRFAFKQGGVETGTFDTAVQKFNKRLGESATTGGTADEAFKRLGVSLRDSEGNVREAGGAMEEILPKLGNIKSDSERAAVAGDLFGQRAGPELAAALSDGAGGIEKARQKAQDLGIVMGEDAAKKAEQFTDSFDDIKQSTLGLLRTGLTPLMGWMTDSLFPFIQDKIIPALSDFRDWIGPKLTAAANKVSKFFTGTLVPAFQKMSAWWDKNGPTVIATAQKIWGAIQKMSDIVSASIGVVVGWFGKSEGKASKTGKNVASTFKTLKSVLSTVFDAIADVISTVIGWIQRAWEQWGSDILSFAKSTFNNILNFLDGILTAIGGVFDVFAGLFTGDWERMWGGVKAIFAGIWDAIKAILSQAFDSLGLLWTVFKDTFAKLWKSFWTSTKQTLKGILDGIVGFFVSLPGWVVGALSGAWGIWESFWRGVWTAVKDFVSDRVDDVVGFVTSLPGRAREALAETWETLKSFWTDVFDDLKEGVSDRIDDMIDFFKELPSRITDGLGDLGSLLLQAGKDLLGGLAEGVKSAVGTLGSALKDAVTGAADKIPFVDAKGDGPGFGVPGAAGGAAMDRAQAAMQGLPVSVTSTYRTPAENARVGGSPTSYHMDKSNPAVDIGGPTWALDIVAARLREMNANRELLWRVPKHFDHVHVAHKGGEVTPRGIQPIRQDELLTKLKSGETVRTRQQESELRGGGDTIHIHLESQGNVRDDAQAAKLALMR